MAVLRRPRQHVPVLAVLVPVAVGLVLLVMESTRPGVGVLAAATWVAVGLRAWLPRERVGLLAVRSRRLDLLVTGVLAVALSVLAVVIPVPVPA